MGSVSVDASCSCVPEADRWGVACWVLGAEASLYVSAAHWLLDLASARLRVGTAESQPQMLSIRFLSCGWKQSLQTEQQIVSFHCQVVEVFLSSLMI